MNVIFAFAGIFVAVFTRTFLAYRYKLITALVRDEEVRWSHRYLASSVSALAYGLISVTIITQSVALPEDPVSLLFTFLTSFFYGWGINDAFNKIFIDWTKHWKRIKL